MVVVSPHKDTLLALAVAMTEKAYAPYSKFYVGACIEFEDGSFVGGANVENASYGLSMCAERVAVFQGVMRQAGRIKAIAIANKSAIFPYPCGACRQVLSEWGDNFPVHIINGEGKVEDFTFFELLPFQFRF